MAEKLEKFNVFVIDNASKDDAIEMCRNLGIENKKIFEYDILKIDDVREIKNKSSIATNEKQAFILGSMGLETQNALLKLLEEPYPLNYFILYKSHNLLETIKSRAQIIRKKIEYEKDEKLINALKNNDIETMLIEAAKLQILSKEDVISVLKGVARALSTTQDFQQSSIINEELVKFEQFNLNQKLFLFALFFKLLNKRE